MKNVILLLSTALLLIVCKPAAACVQDTLLPTVTVNYDSICPSQIEVRIGNLKLHTENPNILCSCALNQYSNLFTNLTYVAFVTAGTNNPYPNFKEWTPNATASSAWGAHLPGNSWDGFVGEVINSGLMFNDAVEMIIRAVPPPGWKISAWDTSLVRLGTDMLDGTIISGSHTRNLDLRSMSTDISSFTTNLKSPSYFTDLDNTISSYYQALDFSSVEVDNLKVNIYPNPINNVMNIQLVLENSDVVEVTVMDINGRTVKSFLTEQLPIGQNDIKIDNELESGFYMITIKQGDNQNTTKVFKS